jgi:LPXTG-motif cell wall-anchored protein
MKNRILSLLLALGLVFAFAVNASATELPVEMPDLGEKGSLSFTMDVDGEPLDSGRLNLYYVATVEPVDKKQYDFRLVEALAAAGAQLDTGALQNGAQAVQLLEKAMQVLPGYRSAPIEDGKVSFAELDAGLYLVWQREADASEGYAAIQPFLISVPRLQNGSYVMHVVADPKVPFETEPTEPPPPPPPPPPDLPQTGQLNWPVPVMGFAGVVLFITGWVLCVRRKRIEHEE